MDEYEEVFGVKPTSSESRECLHKNMEKDENGLHVCVDCGFEQELPDYSPEWRVYTDDRDKNPMRCHSLTPDQSSLDKLLEKNNIVLPEYIKTRVEQKYNKIIKTVHNRGKARLSIIAACLFVVYKELGITQTNEQIRAIFNNLSKKSLTDGLGIYNRYFPEERNNVTRAHQLIGTFTKDYPNFVDEIVSFTKAMEKKTPVLNRSCPQAIAAACILYYITHEKSIELHKGTFATKVGLSEITINRLMKEIDSIRDRFEITNGETKLKL